MEQDSPSPPRTETAATGAFAIAAAAVPVEPTSHRSGDVVLTVADVATSGIDIFGGIAEVGSVVVEVALDALGTIFSAIDL